MKTVNVKLSGLKACNLTFSGLGEVVSRGLRANVIRMAIETDDIAYVTLDQSEGLTVGSAGSFSYTSPEGQRFNVNYTADENGFR